MAVSEALSEEEMCLYAILTDVSGIDLAEFCWTDHENQDDCWRAWPFQWDWWRNQSPLQIDQCSRSVGKSLGIKARSFAFPFCRPGQEMVITAPELVHLEPIVSLVERQFYDTRLGREMLPHGRSAVTHRPFQMNFLTGARIIGRIPQITGKGVKGLHPISLELDECFPAGTMVLSARGLIPIESVEVGDEVLTHRQRWRPVTHTMKRGLRPAVRVRGQGHPGLVVSADHKFWGQHGQHWVAGGTGWEWIAAQDMEGDYWSSPTRVPPLPVPPIPLSPTNVKRPIDPLDEVFLYLVGLYIAEGSCSSAVGGGPLNRVTWSLHEDEVDHVQKMLDAVGLRSSANRVRTSKAVNVLVNHSNLARWLSAQCGSGAANKQVPVWVLGLNTEQRQAVLDGIVFGDGFDDPDRRYAPGRWKVTTVSRGHAIGLRILAQSLGFYVSVYWCDTTQCSGSIRGKGFYQVVGNTRGQGFDVDGLRLTKVREVATLDEEEMYDLTVDEDHSFVAEGVVVSNCQDYPPDGWTELIETLKRGSVGSVWRAHGVTRGIRDKFYEFTQEGPDNHWKIHRITAIHRPNWTDEERQEKIRLYGSREAPDYRRNVLGMHGDQTNPLFVLHRLMRCVDSVEASDYNADEYLKYSIKAEPIEEEAGPLVDDQARVIEGILDFPSIHRRHGDVFWCGMDVGFTAAPSEILVFVEYTPKAPELKADLARGIAGPEDGKTRLKLLCRINLQRIGHPLQVRVIERVIDFYRPKAFALDKTGVGLPLFQELQTRRLEVARIVKGYGFSEKVIVDIDGTVVIGDREDVLKEAAIKSNVLEYSTDKLRELVDHGRMLMPWDRDLIREFQGQTFSFSKATMDMYGRRRRIFSQGEFHALDAARMVAMAHAQNKIEAFIEDQKHVTNEDVLDMFVMLS